MNIELEQHIRILSQLRTKCDDYIKQLKSDGFVRSALIDNIPHYMQDLHHSLLCASYNVKETISSLEDLQADDPPPGVGGQY